MVSLVVWFFWSFGYVFDIVLLVWEGGSLKSQASSVFFLSVFESLAWSIFGRECFLELFSLVYIMFVGNM